MDPIVLSAIKKAKEELALKLESGTSGTGSTLVQLKNSLEAKLSPWTDTRAAKLDRLDAKVSSRADGSYYTPARASKLDKLDTNVSSRADGSYYTPARASKLDQLDAKVSTRASGYALQSSTAQTNQLITTRFDGLDKVAQEIQKEKIFPANSRISTYNINNQVPKGFLVPSEVPPGTTLYGVQGSGKLLYFAASISQSDSTGGVIFDIEMDGSRKFTLRVQGEYFAGGLRSSNVLIYSLEGALFNKKVGQILACSTLKSLDVKGGIMDTSYCADLTRHTDNLDPLREFHAYCGGDDLCFKESLKIKVKEYTGKSDRGFSSASLIAGTLVN